MAAVIAWSIGLRAWVWDSGPSALRWDVILVILLIPGIILLSFARRASKLSLLPDRVRTELGPAVAGTGRACAAVRTKGLGLKALIGRLENAGSGDGSGS